MEEKIRISDIVYDKINIERRGIVVGKFKMYGGIEKNLISWPEGSQTDHYDFELLTEEEYEFEKYK